MIYTNINTKETKNDHNLFPHSLLVRMLIGQILIVYHYEAKDVTENKLINIT